ncbi:vWA domain-containing protein [Pseudoponticoccus marisrubri]|uniref:VWFA domain-containing protein n=1 Tax=Pseudoponticoccus marisrubri TaxID=1685382 RepID=A0A0W7WNE9_9RHOB|nr:VWA domain-containing protein [Pseudoponticoccus marisrubri]KUF12049.1 hypothetical protein AVJ23_05605 [Pseudoponticoccus marisrubri]
MVARVLSTCALLALGAAPLAVGPHPAAAQEGARTMLVLDASGSMWGQIDGTAKIDIARGAIGDLLAGLPQDSTVGLMAYGHRRQGDCNDIEVLVPAGPLDRAGLAVRLDTLTPRGKTPIAAALRAAAAQLGDSSGPARVILISDGRETCVQDACSAVRDLAGQGVDIRAHVIGFDVDEAATAELTCIARATGGTYRGAGTAASLAGALTTLARAETGQSMADATAPETMPASQPEPAIVETFDGTALGDSWQVINPDPNAYLVEGGRLITLTSGATAVGQEDLTNGFLWQGQPLPEGDWDMSVTFTAPQFTTRRSNIELGLYKDPGNFVIAGLFGDGSSNDRLVLQVKSAVGGDVSRQTVTFADDACCPRDYDIEQVLAQLRESGGRLVLQRRGRAYTAVIETEDWTPRAGQDNPLATAPLTVLRAAGDPVIHAGTWGRDYGRLPQTTVEIDRFEVIAR